MHMWRVRVCTFFAAAGALLGQREFSPFDAQTGARLYIANCIYCHGPDGDQVPGIDLGHGKFKHASTDAEIVEIIRKGIPNTGMPAQTNMPVQQVKYIVAYLRSLAADPSGALPPGADAARGKMIFESKGQCLTCHRVKDTGSRLGPDLSDIGGLRRLVEIQKTLADPQATLLPQNRFFHLVTRDGSSVTGRILNQDTFTVEMIDARERLLSFQKADLKEFVAVKSPMPSYQGKLTSAEMADLMAYLVSLKGR
jgi:putative heme-binding domain-containing protein